MVTVRAVLCGIVITAASLSGCSVYDESLLPAQSRQPGCGDGSSQPPTRPPVTADGEDTPLVVFALKNVLFDTSASGPFGEVWQTTGFNLDDRCSTIENGHFACTAPGSSPNQATDGIGGIDNVFGPVLFPLVNIQYSVLVQDDPNPYATDLQAYAERVQEEGMAVLLLRITEWNGMPNDPHVRVDVSQSVYGAPGTDFQAPVVDLGSWVPGTSTTTPPVQPAWLGNDWFWAREDSFIAKDAAAPVIFDDTAYVANNQLVMHLPARAQLIFVGPTLGLNVTLTGGVAVGTITQDRQMLENLLIGGRWAVTDLLQTSESVGVCPGSATYNLIKDNILANNADVRSDAATDGTGVPCDALSMGVELTGYRAHFAGLVPGPPLPDPCP